MTDDPILTWAARIEELAKHCTHGWKVDEPLTDELALIAALDPELVIVVVKVLKGIVDDEEWMQECITVDAANELRDLLAAREGK